jgi:hypothetical protein
MSGRGSCGGGGSEVLIYVTEKISEEQRDYGARQELNGL